MSRLNAFIIGVIFLIIIFRPDAVVHAEENICQKQVVINSSGKFAFGKILEPPGDYSVWFPIVPRAIAIDSTGNIYIGDSVNYRVIKFNKKGEAISAFKLQPSTRVKKPELSHIIQDMAIDKDDNLYVINRYEYRVEIYDKNGKFLRFIDYLKEKIGCYDKKEKPTDMYIPQRINIDKMNNVYLFERNSAPSLCGGVYSPQGKLIKRGIQVDYHGRGKLNYDERQMVDFYGYYYELPTKTTDKTLSIRDMNNRILKKCVNVTLATDEDGEIYKTDMDGNIYTFDYYDTLNLIKITPFKSAGK